MSARVFVLRLHRATALVAGGLLLLVGASGAVLVFRSELEDALSSGALRAAPGDGRAPLQTLLDAAQQQHRALAPRALTLAGDDDRPARVTLESPSREEVEVLLDPSSARVLGSRWQERSPLHALRMLHAELYLGRRGRLVVGGLGLLLALQGATGLYLWWPFTRRLGRGFAIRWRRPWPVVGYDLHKTVGIASLAFNLPIALSGALLGFSAAASLLPGPADGPPLGGGRPLALDDIALSAEAALPGGRIVSLHLGAREHGTVVVRKRLPGDPDPRGGSAVRLDAHTGAALAVTDAHRGPLGHRLWALVAPLHFGSFGGAGSRLLYAVGGLTSSVLVLTGLVIWLTRPAFYTGHPSRRQPMSQNIHS